MRLNGKQICERDCPDRSPSCHGTCEKYLQFHEDRKAQNEAKLKEKTIDRMNTDSIRRAKNGNYNSIRRYRPKEK